MRWFSDTSYVVSASAEMASGSVAGAVHPDSVDLSEQSISQTAEAFGVTMRTLRFYESKGLLEPRRIGNRRFYNEACRARLRLVLKGKAMGLGLDEIGELVELVESDLTDGERAKAVRTLCERQRELLTVRRDTINEQINETSRVIDGLTSL
ncbi:MerR family transcriptional regulator [Ahrensia marina]|jgi:DNA-binding transcriptional MerR regulator|uniref:MerR family transcriptional regulator n=1 Tax=Ahrensia marina TaxID=1514904 RepID=UPI0035CFB0F3